MPNTVTVKPQVTVAPGLLEVGPPVVMQVTVLEPTGKDEPEGGVQVTVLQSPVVVGAG